MRNVNPGGKAMEGEGRRKRPAPPRPTLLWPTAPPTPRLSPEAIDVHAFHLDAEPDEREVAAALLEAEERARAARFHTPLLRDRYTVGRATLRRILAAYTGADPRTLRFAYGAHGKPAIQPEGDLHFNLSHTEGLALLAVATGFPAIGVDVERTERPVDLEPLARRCFGGEEYAGFLPLEGRERTLGFFLGWTRKEAYMKATGEGLARPLDTFEVELRPGAEPRFLRLPGPDQPAEWTLEHLVPAPEYVAALAVRAAGRPLRVRSWSWTHSLR